MGLIGGIRAREIGIRALALNAIHPRARSKQCSSGVLANDSLIMKECVEFAIKTESER